jgi:dTDP-glucose 4,6-dehydratase
MNYFVTGGAGFIGSNYVRMLLTNQLGPVSKVTVLDKLTYAGNLENLSEVVLDPRFQFVKGDICDENLVRGLISKNDIVVHFAAESHVDRSISGPSEFVRTNVLGTQILLSAAVVNEAQLFLHVSTDEVYGSIESGSSIETDPLMPNSPYSASKAASDLLVRSYIQTFGLNAKITRCCNNYGPNQYPEKFIPLSISKLKQNKRIPVYGDGLNVREWIHVKDHCKGIQEVIEFGDSGEIYNIGSGFLISNIHLAEKIVQVFSKEFETSIEFIQDRLGHDIRYSLNSNKFHQLTSKLQSKDPSTEDFKLMEFLNRASRN